MGPIRVSTPSFVSASPHKPLSRTACRASTASYQPIRRGRPVALPNSSPSLRSASPSLPLISLGNGPPPTRVVYALAIPSTQSSLPGATPAPPTTARAPQFDEVTYG